MESQYAGAPPESDAGLLGDPPVLIMGMGQFERIQRMHELVTKTAWGDTLFCIGSMKEMLPYMMRLSAQEFAAWEAGLGGDEVDEFSVPLEDAFRQPVEWRLAHIARLIRSLAMSFGVDTNYGTPKLTDRVDPSSPAAVLNELSKIALLPTQATTRSALLPT